MIDITDARVENKRDKDYYDYNRAENTEYQQDECPVE